MTKFLVALLGLAAAAVLLYFGLAAGPAPKEVAFARAGRETLISTIVTNGRIEPSGYTAVRAPRQGSLLKLGVEKGQPVQAGQIIAEIDGMGFAAEIQAADSQIAQARAELALFDRGGTAAALTEIDNATASAQLELGNARRDKEQSARLVEKNAETKEALALVTDRVRQIEARLEALGRSRTSQLPPGGKDPVQARLRQAEAARTLAEQRLAQGTVRAPIAGVVFNVAVRSGAFLNPGDLIAEIGRTGKVNAIVYIDEPELGRVSRGMPVKITWDAMPNRTWDAVVEKLPTQIVPLNSRQIGEVLCTLANEAGLLPPGANINAEVRSSETAGALAIPKAALRREGVTTGVLVLVQPQNKLEWRRIELGVASLTHAGIATGLREGELVALPGETPIVAGETVLPKLP